MKLSFPHAQLFQAKHLATYIWRRLSNIVQYGSGRRAQPACSTKSKPRSLWLVDWPRRCFPGQRWTSEESKHCGNLWVPELLAQYRQLMQVRGQESGRFGGWVEHGHGVQASALSSPFESVFLCALALRALPFCPVEIR